MRLDRLLQVKANTYQDNGIQRVVVSPQHIESVRYHLVVKAVAEGVKNCILKRGVKLRIQFEELLNLEHTRFGHRNLVF